MASKTWSDEELKIAVKSSFSKGEVLKKLGLKSHNSGNYQTIDSAIKRLSLDISHFKGTPTNLSTKEWKLEDILIENSPYTSTQNLKKKLLKHKLLINKCYGKDCGINEWLGNKLSLQLDHINGDRSDNRIENLRLLCPNCHSLTSTFCRGISRQSKKKCLDCGSRITKSNSRCQKCSGLKRKSLIEKIDWPDRTLLQHMIDNLGFSETGRKINVSDNAVRKKMNRMINLAVIGTCDKCGSPATHRIVKRAHIHGEYCESCCPVTQSTIDLINRDDLEIDVNLKNQMLAKASKNGIVS